MTQGSAEKKTTTKGAQKETVPSPSWEYRRCSQTWLCGFLLFKMNNKSSEAMIGRKNLPLKDAEEAEGTQMYVFQLCFILHTFKDLGISMDIQCISQIFLI